MASRDSQSLQFVVITLAILVFLLFGGLVLVNNAKSDAQAQVANLQSQVDEARQAQRDTQAEANSYKEWIGFQEADNFSTLQQLFTEDMDRFGKDFDDNQKFYRTILESFVAENQSLSDSESLAKQEVKRLKETLLATEAQKEAQIAEIQAALDKANEDANSQRTDFNARTKEINDQKDEIAARVAEQQAKMSQMETGHEEEINALNEKIVKLERVAEILQNNQLDPDPFAQPADGVIRYVNQRNRTVWINLGEADNLRPQVTFSVYDGDENDALGAERKGSIEVTRILSPHMAEARITDDQAVRPLLSGDKIYSQVWNPGRQVGFAIAGLIDMDGDGRSDMDQLKQVISLNNGKVDAMPNSDGSVEGEMSVDTRYLVLGKYPEGSGQEAARSAWESMSADADTLGVETITLDEFLSLMGWKSEQRTVPLGTSARSEDFRAHPRKDYAPPSSSTKAQHFRPRKPQPTY